MNHLLTIHPTELYNTLQVLKDLLRPRFPEQPKPQGPGGCPRQWPRGLIVALALIGVSLSLSWNKYTQELQRCEQELRGCGATKVPGKTSLFNAWREMTELQLIRQVTQLGRILVPTPENLAIDSTGFMMKGGSIWRVVKWTKSLLKRTSRLFHKVHLIVDTETQTILSCALSQAHIADIKRTGPLLKHLGKRVIRTVKRVYGDKAYNDSKFEGYLHQHGIRLVVEPKANAVDHGTTSERDNSLRLYRSNRKFWFTVFRCKRKAAVEHTNGTVKQLLTPLRERKPIQRRKRLLVYLFQYNFRLLLQTTGGVV